MNQNIKVLDEESKHINWDRIDYLMMRFCKSVTLFAKAVVTCTAILYALDWLWRF